MLSFSLVALAAIGTQAQVMFGVKAGLNMATFTGSDASSSNLPGKSMKAGANFGGLVHIPVTSNFSVQPEVYFSMEGCKVDGGTYDLSYINIPVLAMYRFGASHFSAGTGPQLGLLTSAKVKPTGGSSTDIKDLLQSSDFAWAFLLNYLTSANVGFEARYNAGLGTIDKGTPKDKFTNSVLQFNLFYLFGGKRK